MPSYVTPKKGVQYIFYVSLVQQADTRLMKVNPTIAAGDFKVSIDGGALANLATLPVVTPASSVMVKVTLSTSESNGDNVTVVCSDAAGAEWCDQTINIQTSARQIDDLAVPGDAMALTALHSLGVESGTAQAGSSGTITLRAGASAVDSFYRNQRIDIVSGTGTGQSRIIVTYVGAVLIATLDEAWITAPDNTSIYRISARAPRLDSAGLGVVKANLAQILGTALTETAGLLAGGFKQFFNVASPTLTCLGIDQTGNSYARLGAPAGASVSADIAAVKAKTDLIPGSPAAVGSAMTLTSGERDSIAAAHLDLANGIETGLTPRQASRLVLAASAGKLSGAATTTVTIRNVGDTKNRITATVDASGNRSAVTTDGT